MNILIYLRVFSIIQPHRGLSGKESACKAGDTGDMGLIPGSGRSLGGGDGNPLQYSCLGEPHGRSLEGYSPGVTKSQTLSMHAVHKLAQL